MDTADQLVREIFSWITQGKTYAHKLRTLDRELDSEREGANAAQRVGTSTGVVESVMIGVSWLNGKLDTPFLTCFTGSKLEENCAQKILGEARDILDRSNKIMTRIQELFEKLKHEKKLNSPFDPEELDKHIMADVLMAVGTQRGLDMSKIVPLYERLTDFRFPDGALVCGPQLGSSDILMSVCAVLSIFNLKTGGKSMELLATSGFKGLSGGLMLTGAAMMTYFLPEAIDRWKELIENNHVTEAGQSLKSRAEEILKITEKLMEEFNTIEESLKKQSQITSIIEKENRSCDEKKKLIDYVIANAPDPVVQQWFRENAESDIFFNLVNLRRFIKEKLNEEADKKEKNRKRKKIEVIFLAHGRIESRMIPARCLLPLSSITDVHLYSPWNCFLSAKAAYSIAAGSIKPHHRRFLCTNTKCHFSHEAHGKFGLHFDWNCMRSVGTQEVPNIMVSPVRAKGDKQKDEAFEVFTALAAHFGPLAENRYLITYLATSISEVPFFVVTLAISLVLSSLRQEATVHLAACLGRSSEYTIMAKEYLNQQYGYTLDYTSMTVPTETIQFTDRPLFDMFKEVFDDVPPSF